MPHWLLVSIIGSVVLTVALNLILRLFPDTARRAQDRLFEEMQASDEPDEAPGPRFRVFFPWRFMLVASIVLTLLANLAIRIAGSF